MDIADLQRIAALIAPIADTSVRMTLGGDAKRAAAELERLGGQRRTCVFDDGRAFDTVTLRVDGVEFESIERREATQAELRSLEGKTAFKVVTEGATSRHECRGAVLG